jgi:hypothetical protein
MQHPEQQLWFHALTKKRATMNMATLLDPQSNAPPNREKKAQYNTPAFLPYLQSQHISI